MKENEYDKKSFFDKYSKMERSVKGLQGAGEWYELKRLIPSINNKDVLDIGCGFGWHCKYASDNGANIVVGIDISKNMINTAQKINNAQNIRYEQIAIEDYSYPADTFDIVLSSLALHYIENFDDVCKKVYTTLKTNSNFIFSIEHPIFTANETQTWEINTDSSIKNWPIDNYFYERKINTNFLGEDIVKYHRTLTTLIYCLINNGFTIQNIVEPMPSKDMLDTVPEMKEELRRPMMLLISAIKQPLN